MSVTITFHEISEKKPRHGQVIIWLRPTESFGYSGFNPTEIEVEYSWEDLDENADPTGDYISYVENDKVPMGARLVILFGGIVVSNDSLWISLDEYWKSFDGVM